MENRSPAAVPPVARRPRTWFWLTAGVAALAVLGWWALAPGSGPAAPAAATTVVDPPGTLPGAAVAVAARIVDAAPGPAQTQGEPDSMLSAAGTDPLAGLAPSDAVPPADPFAAVVAADGAPARAARPRPARRPAAAAPATSTGAGDPDLLSTLLHNIESSKETAAAEAASLDTLVRQLRDEDAPSRRRRSEQIQSNLRECPAPNTVEGLDCRQAICAVYAGRDPACPALN